MNKRIKALFIIISLTLSTGFSQAGDAALKRIIGFSADGQYFAFEQYGIQDGSGFPYADIFFINTKTNQWIKDTPPIRIFIKDENASLGKTRAQAIAQATPFIKKFGTTLHGFTLVSNPITQLDRKKRTAHFGIHPSAPTLNQYKLNLVEHKLQNSDCKTFALTLTSVSPQSQVAKYTDRTLPKSRGCPVEYSISDVHYFEATNGDTVFLTFINVMKIGFESPERRFIVTPFYIKK